MVGTPGARGLAGRGGQAFLSQHARFHLVYRLAARAYQFGVARSSPGAARWRTRAALACAVCDVAGAALLRWGERRNQRLAIAPRLLLDAADGALWCSDAGLNTDAAVLCGVPLAAEAGLRLGRAGIVVPVLNAAVATAVRRAKGLRPAPGAFGWQVMGVAAGAGFAAYESWHRRNLMARHHDHLAAELSRAHQCGQHAVAMAADSVVDLLTRTTPLLGRGVGAFGEVELAAWKSALAAQATAHATYLGVALSSWERTHNLARAELRSNVTLVLAEDHGTVLLSANQAAGLWRQLDGLGLAGRVEVALAEPARARLAGRSRDLVVGGRRLAVPPDGHLALRAADIGPPALLCGALWWADLARPISGGASVISVGFACLASLVTAGWAHARVHQAGDAARPAVLNASQVLAIINTALVSPRITQPYSTDGVQVFPFMSGLYVTAILASAYWADLGPAQRVTTVSLAVANIVLGLVALEESPHWASLALELLWPLAALISVWRLPAAFAADAAAQAAELAVLDDQRIEEAFETGRGEVISIVAKARQEAQRILLEMTGRLDPLITAEATRRLAEVDRRMGELACAGG